MYSNPNMDFTTVCNNLRDTFKFVRPFRFVDDCFSFWSSYKGESVAQVVTYGKTPQSVPFVSTLERRSGYIRCALITSKYEKNSEQMKNALVRIYLRISFHCFKVIQYLSHQRYITITTRSTPIPKSQVCHYQKIILTQSTNSKDQMTIKCFQSYTDKSIFYPHCFTMATRFFLFFSSFSPRAPPTRKYPFQDSFDNVFLTTCRFFRHQWSIGEKRRRLPTQCSKTTVQVESRYYTFSQWLPAVPDTTIIF